MKRIQGEFRGRCLHALEVRLGVNSKGVGVGWVLRVVYLLDNFFLEIIP